MVRIIPPSEPTRQPSNKACQIIAQSKKIRATSLTPILARRLITPKTTHNSRKIQKTSSGFSNLHVND